MSAGPTLLRGTSRAPTPGPSVPAGQCPLLSVRPSCPLLSTLRSLQEATLPCSVGTQPLGVGVHFHNSFELDHFRKRSCHQIRSRSEVLGTRAPAHHSVEDTIQPPACLHRELHHSQVTVPESLLFAF